MTSTELFTTLPTPSDDAPCGVTVLARFIDGLGFRYRWATDGLERQDLAFRPCESSMDLGELLDHERFLARWMRVNVGAALKGSEPVTYPECCQGLSDPGGDPALLIEQTLIALSELRQDILALGDEGLRRVTLIGGKEPTSFPVWNMMNGPLADALTHVGQVTSWRRILGKPVPRHDVFRGRPPRPS